MSDLTPRTEECAHIDIETHSDAENGPVMWACGGCSLRFYPACRKCVTVGHRNGHNEEWRATLDAARVPVSPEGWKAAMDDPAFVAEARAALDHEAEAERNFSTRSIKG